jgi:hypothetical protein
MKQRATILDIIEAGLWGNQERVRAYTELLIERIEAEQDTPQEERERDVVGLRKLLERRDSGDRGRVISPAQVTSLRTQIVVGSISKLAQEELQAAHATIEQIHQDSPLFLVSLEHQEWYRTRDGAEYRDLEMENGRLIIRSHDLEVSYDRKPYDIAQTTITSIYEP